MNKALRRLRHDPYFVCFCALHYENRPAGQAKLAGDAKPGAEDKPDGLDEWIG